MYLYKNNKEPKEKRQHESKRIPPVPVRETVKVETDAENQQVLVTMRGNALTEHQALELASDLKRAVKKLHKKAIE